ASARPASDAFFICVFTARTPCMQSDLLSARAGDAAMASNVAIETSMAFMSILSPVKRCTIDEGCDKSRTTAWVNLAAPGRNKGRCRIYCFEESGFDGQVMPLRNCHIIAAVLLACAATSPAMAESDPGDCLGVDYDARRPLVVAKVVTTPRAHFVKSHWED